MQNKYRPSFANQTSHRASSGPASAGNLKMPKKAFLNWRREWESNPQFRFCRPVP